MARLDFYPLFQDIRGLVGRDLVQAAMKVHFESEHHHVEGHIFGDHKLVISFGHAPWRVLKAPSYKPGWDVAPFLRRGISVLAVKPKSGTACLTGDLAEVFDRIAPFLARFAERVSYGFSAGGFVALSHGDRLGVSRIVVVAPQVAAHPIPGAPPPRVNDLAEAADPRDVMDGCRTVPEIWVLHDPLDGLDAAHARRVTGPAVRHVTTPCTGHGVITMLQKVGLGEVPAELCLYGDIDLPEVYRRLRDRRQHFRYREVMMAHAERHPALLARLERLEAQGVFAPKPDPFHAPDTDEG